MATVGGSAPSSGHAADEGALFVTCQMQLDRFILG